MQYRPPL
jgi:lipid II:glycine glycyltransferase (peptidoglycan interpeptide bridge formation enzyme)